MNTQPADSDEKVDGSDYREKSPGYAAQNMLYRLAKTLRFDQQQAQIRNRAHQACQRTDGREAECAQAENRPCRRAQPVLAGALTGILCPTGHNRFLTLIRLIFDAYLQKNTRILPSEIGNYSNCPLTKS